jgi:hypothetical protein
VICLEFDSQGNKIYNSTAGINYSSAGHVISALNETPTQIYGIDEHGNIMLG